MIVFGGQGSPPSRGQLEGALATDRGARLLERATRAAGLDDVAALGARGGRALERTAVLQPVVVALGLAAFEPLCASVDGAALTLVGHSLGEVAAVAASGALAFEDAIDLAAERGRAMEAASRARPGGLFAMERADATRALASVAGLFVALDNAPDEVVVGGDAAALAEVARVCPGRRLRVEGAFHGPTMASAADAMDAACRAAPFGAPSLRLLTALDAGLVESAERARDVIALGPSRTMRFRETIALAARGARRDIVVGPARAVRALLRQNVPAVEVHASEPARDVERARTVLREAS
jgi:[acyl-carrier-protein] S-malonyltransferase